ncbi:MAG: efflux RND transporter periplasmic adaptor subunit [Alkalispirochaeta sp.]
MTRTNSDRRPRRAASIVTIFRLMTILIVGAAVLGGCDRLPGGPGRSGSTDRGDPTASGSDKSESTDTAGSNGSGESTGSDENLVRGRDIDTVFAVNVTPAVQGQIADYIEVNGDVQTTASIDIYSDAAGEIVRLYVGIGETLRADQVIAEVDPSRPGQNFALSPVKAPINGTITRLPVRVGSRINQSAPVAQISRTTELEIVVQIAERFVSKVREGLPATIRLDAFPERDFSAVVSKLNPVVDPMTRTLEVTLSFTGDARGVRPGMYAEVQIITEQKENIVKVPADVLIRRFGENFVYVVRDDNTVERRVVNPGIEIDNILEITDGLEAGEPVVYEGQNLLEDGSPVRIIDTVTPLGGTDESQ